MSSRIWLPFRSDHRFGGGKPNFLPAWFPRTLAIAPKIWLRIGLLGQRQLSGVINANTQFGQCTTMHTYEPYRWCALEENVPLSSIDPQWPKFNHDVERCWADTQWNPCWCHPISTKVSIGVARHQLTLSGLPLSSDMCHIPTHTWLFLFSSRSTNAGVLDHGTSWCFRGAWRIWRGEPHPKFSSWGPYF